MSFNILHTSDWHLGKRPYGRGLETEQRLFLEWLAQQIKSRDIHLLIIAGDVFDHPRPAGTAQVLYYDFLDRVTQNQSLQVIVLAGNHDSGPMLEAPKELLKNRQIHIIGQLSSHCEHHNIKIDHPNLSPGFLWVSALPYFKGYELFELKKLLGLRFQPWADAANEAKNILEALLVKWRDFKGQKNSEGMNACLGHLFIGHHVFGPFERAGSELPLSLSGLDSIPLSLFTGDYDYMALGHMHKAQKVKKANPLAIYPGSPLALRTTEFHQKKCATIQWKGPKEFEFQWLNIPCWRPFYYLATNSVHYNKDIDDFINAHPVSSGQLPPYLEIEVELWEANSQVLLDIKKVFADTDFEILDIKARSKALSENEATPNVHCLSMEELFIQFYQKKFDGQSPSGELMDDFQNLLAKALSQKESS